MLKTSLLILHINYWKSFSGGGGTRLVSSPQRGEEAIVHERIASVTSAGEGEIAAKQLGSETAVGRICQSDNKIKTLYNTS